MKALVQRVSRASVIVAGRQVSTIGEGMLVLLGVDVGDRQIDAERLARRVRALRIFADAEGAMNEPLRDREILCVSQFTLCANTRKGNRPSFSEAAAPTVAEPLYKRFCEEAKALEGVFGAKMSIEMVCDGPVTVLLESRD
jgi:D-tyrosyl-tRNA(Tyr) deacylase